MNLLKCSRDDVCVGAMLNEYVKASHLNQLQQAGAKRVILTRCYEV